MTWCIPHLSAFATSLSISPSLYLFCSVHKCKRAFSRLMRVPRKKWAVPQLTGAYGMVRVPRNLDSFFYDCLVLVEFFDLSSGASEFSLFVCSNVDSGRYGLIVVLNWRNPPQNGNLLEEFSVEQNNHSVLANWSNWGLSSPLWFTLETDLSVHLTLGFTALCGRPAASLEFLHSLIPFHNAYRISACCCHKHNSRRHPLSMLVPRQEWSVSQLRGVYGTVRVPRNLDCTHLVDGSLLSGFENVSTQPMFSIWMRRETCREDNQTRIGDTKNKFWWEKGAVPQNAELLLYNCPILVEFLWCVMNCIWTLSVPLFGIWLWSCFIHRDS